ncbi:M81 family metallopeptidase [Paenibacillus agaridevorans]|uniref:M81 family metallopeptidase n=1 Tax=Paenibacillus agaridevorans TaxID=171404 RepID=UPI001BE3D626|nr:M81 family metallopeptidase [Paenibacillus agaridevorans]
MTKGDADTRAARIVVGGILQESNTFSIAASPLTDFRQNYWFTDDELLTARMWSNELGGFLAALAERGAVPLPTLYTGAISSGCIPRSTVNQLKEQLYPRIARHLEAGCDGILLALHGAWVAADEDDLCGEVLAEVRAMAGAKLPIVLSLDSHANLTERMVNNVNALAGYRTFPHIDYRETGYLAGKLLLDIIEGRCDPIVVFRKIPMILQAENHQTYRGPMFELWQEAQKGEEAGASAATSLFAVQPWLDVKEMGCSVVVIGERARSDAAEAEADRLARLFWHKRHDFEIQLHSVGQILQIIRDRQVPAPAIASDSADSPGAGSPGDSNQVLRQLLALGASTWLRALIPMVDPSAARAALAAGEGRLVRLRVGHAISSDNGEPLEIEGRVTRVTDGRFRFGGGYIPGFEANMGACAVVAIGTLQVLLMELPVFTGDPAMYRSAGLEPTEADLVIVKSASQFRQEYEKIASSIYILDTPGASTANLMSLPFRHIPSPIFPFEDDFAPGVWHK